MIATTVKTMKLVMKMRWNSLASASVSPDRDDLSLVSHPWRDLRSVTAHALRGGIVVTRQVSTGDPADAPLG